MKKSKTDKHLLYQLMFSLYPAPETIYREYIQNATDSILEAEQLGILEKNEGHISIETNDNKQEIRITDNGKGLPENEAETILKDISVSTKRDKDYTAGYFGIGKFVGAGYCKKMTFRTSTKGENKISELSFDVTKIREILDDPSIDMSPNDVIDECTSFTTYEKENKNDHFFEVILSEIKAEYVEHLLDENLIHNFLIQISPIDYDIPFNSTLFLPNLDKTGETVKNEVPKLTHVKLTLNKSVDIRKAYGLKVEGTEDRISGIRFFILTDVKYGNLAWGWYALTPFSTQISETNISSLTRGLRLRIKNIQIGTESYFDGTEYFKEPRGNKYFNGEIHVINKNIKPVADRSDIQPTKEGQALKNKIHEFCLKELGPLYRNANTAKTAIQNYEKSVTAVVTIENKKITTNYTKEDKEKELKLAKEKQARVTQDLQKKVIEKEGKNEADKAVLDIYKEKAKTITEKPLVISSSTEKFVSDANNTPIKPNNPPEAKKEDKFAELRSKYSPEQMAVIERIFEIIDINFYSEPYQRVVNPVKKRILEELKK